MPETRYIIGQIIAFVFFATGIGYFSSNPDYIHHDPDMAQIKLSFSHSSQRKEKCRYFTPEELAELAPNMRRPMDCPRERVPVYVELKLDDQILIQKQYLPTGLAKDGSTSAYEKISTLPGEHQLVVRMRDSNRVQGFDYEESVTINLKPQQHFVIDFREELGGFRFY